MVDENNIEAKFSIVEIVHLVQSNDHMAIEGLVAGNDEHSDLTSLMQQQTRMTCNARVFT